MIGTDSMNGILVLFALFVLQVSFNQKPSQASLALSVRLVFRVLLVLVVLFFIVKLVVTEVMVL